MKSFGPILAGLVIACSCPALATAANYESTVITGTPINSRAFSESTSPPDRCHQFGEAQLSLLRSLTIRRSRPGITICSSRSGWRWMARLRGRCTSGTQSRGDRGPFKAAEANLSYGLKRLRRNNARSWG